MASSSRRLPDAVLFRFRRSSRRVLVVRAARAALIPEVPSGVACAHGALTGAVPLPAPSAPSHASAAVALDQGDAGGDSCVPER